MFNWLKRKKPTTEEHELENTQPPKIRKPTHAARDARMSIPVGEREYYDILEARKRAGNNSPSIGTSVMKGKGKEKATSPLAYSNSGESFLPIRDKSNLILGVFFCSPRIFLHGLLVCFLRHHFLHRLVRLRCRHGGLLGHPGWRVQEAKHGADFVH